MYISLQGLIGFMANPVLANGLAGLATSATAQATVEVNVLVCNALMMANAEMRAQTAAH